MGNEIISAVMKINRFVNPFILLPLTFILIIWIYSWGWSELLPVLSFEVITFITLLCISFILIGFLLGAKNIIEYRSLSVNHVDKNSPLLVIFLSTLLFLLDVKYSGSIPLFAGNIEDYEEFGMPVIDPLILAILTFYSIYWFHVYVSTKRKKYLLYIVFNMALCLLMARRAALVYILIGMALIYLQQLPRLNFRVILTMLMLVLAFGFVFGYLGNAKAGLENTYIPQNMAASESFKDSAIPNEFYSTYLYICTPLANFQLTSEYVFYEDSFKDLVLQEYVPDFISNKITNIFEVQRSGREMQKVMDVLNVGTFFAGGKMYFGWFGVFLHSTFIILLALGIYLCYPKSSAYHVTLNAFFCALFLMAVFSNVFRIFINWLVVFIPLLPITWDKIKKPKFKFLK